MDQASFAVLDNAIEQGGKNLSAKALGGSAKTGKALLAELCEKGLLSEAKNKYSLTESGRQAWEQAAPAERKAAVQAKADAAEREVLAGFLRVVEKAGGKALKPADLKKFPPWAPEKAAAQQLVEPGAKENSYLLRGKGRQFLLAALPPAQQLTGLRAALGELTPLWEALQQRLERDWRELAGDGAAPHAGIHSRLSAALSGFEDALAETQAFSGLIEAGQRLKEALAGPASDLLSRSLALETELREGITAHQADLESFRHSFEERTRDLESRLAEAPSSQPAPVSAVSASEIWEATRRVYEQLRAQAERLGGIVNIAQLSDGVLPAVPGLDAARFRLLLQQWQQEDRLILQVCNDPRLEPRSSEGIVSDRGLLFYVKLL